MILVELIGPAGSGKTTLIRELELAADAHKIYKKPLKSYNTYLSFLVVFLSLFFKKNVIEIVLVFVFNF